MSEKAQTKIPQGRDAGLQRSPEPLPRVYSQEPSNNPLWALQQTVGNQAILRLFDRGAIQAKLRVSQPGDADELEADRVAEQVVNDTHSPEIHRKCACEGTGSPCAECESEASESATSIRRKQDSTSSGTKEVHDSFLGNLGPGRPLDPAVRSSMEPCLGRDFSDVRVHTGSDAAESARSIHALAYTAGNHVVFGEGQFSPSTEPGKRLLAHELSHVAQQSANPAPVIQRAESTEATGDVDEAALNQCIAEQGGSTGYRDGGLPSAEELARYRKECLGRQTGKKSSSKAIENLGRAWEYAKQGMDTAVERELEGLFSPRSLAVMAALAVLYIGSQFTPVGWVADAVALTLLTLTVVLVGKLVLDIATDVLHFFEAVNATTEDEFRDCGHALSRAIARAGVGIVVALLTRGIRGVAGGSGGAPPPSAAVEALAPEGATVRVLVAASAEEAVAQSRLQQIASYAVMVPPPGGKAPDTSSSSSSGKGGGGEPAKQAGGTGVPQFKLGRVPYGQGALSQLAQAMRLRIGLRRGGNVAVFEFQNIPDAFRSLVARLGGKNAYIEGNRMAVQNVNGAAHSEGLADLLIKAGRKAEMNLNVQRIYTEYNPCTDTCLPLIRDQYPNAEVTYSFTWEKWASETQARNKAVDALFGQQ